MAFCIYCGKQINDGEVCSCQQPAAPIQMDAPVAQPQQEVQDQQYVQPQQEVQPQQYAQPQQTEAQTQYTQPEQPQYAQYQQTQPQQETQPQYTQYQQAQPQYAQYQQTAQPQMNQTAQYQTYQPGAPVQEKKKGKGLLFGLIGGGVALVAAVVILIICLTGGGYKSAINDIADAINDRETNIEKLVKAAAPSFVSDPLLDVYDVVKKSDLGDQLSEIDEEIQEFYEEAEDEVGAGWTIKFDITSERELTETELRKIAKLYKNDLYEEVVEPALEEVNDLDPYDLEDAGSSIGLSLDDMQKIVKAFNEFGESLKNAEVTAGYELKGRIVALDGSGATAEKTDKMTIRVIKINGEWMIDIVGYFEDDIFYLKRYLNRLF